MRTPPPELDPIECRVLGVLIEKALTTPGQYPLSLNALTLGCNQKSNRLPELDLGDQEVRAALTSLRREELVSLVQLSGSRVERYRHTAKATLEAEATSLSLLAELMLRGPQTAGELRTRASRMIPIASLDAVRELLGCLEQESYVRCLPPRPGSRASRFIQRLCPGLHPVEEPEPPVSRSEVPPATANQSALHQRVERLELEVQELRSVLSKLAAELGCPVGGGEEDETSAGAP